MATAPRRGFASLTPEERRRIASKGGKAAQARYRWTSEQAREAGKRGRAKALANRRAG